MIYGYNRIVAVLLLGSVVQAVGSNPYCASANYDLMRAVVTNNVNQVTKLVPCSNLDAYYEPSHQTVIMLAVDAFIAKVKRLERPGAKLIPGVAHLGAGIGSAVAGLSLIKACGGQWNRPAEAQRAETPPPNYPGLASQETNEAHHENNGDNENSDPQANGLPEEESGNGSSSGSNTGSEQANSESWGSWFAALMSWPVSLHGQGVGKMLNDSGRIDEAVRSVRGNTNNLLNVATEKVNELDINGIRNGISSATTSVNNCAQEAQKVLREISETQQQLNSAKLLIGGALGALAVAYGVYKWGLKGVNYLAVPFKNMYVHYQLKSHQKIIETLLRQQHIDLSLTDKEGKTVLDRVHEQMLAYAHDEKVYLLLKNLEQLLKKRLSV